MTQRSTVHDTLVVERKFDYKPELVFAAWASADAKAQWFAGPAGWTTRRGVCTEPIY